MLPHPNIICILLFGASRQSQLIGTKNNYRVSRNPMTNVKYLDLDLGKRTDIVTTTYSIDVMLFFTKITQNLSP